MLQTIGSDEEETQEWVEVTQQLLHRAVGVWKLKQGKIHATPCPNALEAAKERLNL